MGKYEWDKIVPELNSLVRLTNPPVAMKWVKTEEELKKIPKVREHEKHLPPCTIVSHAVQFNWTSACKFENIHANYCRGIHGLFERDDKWFSGEMFNNVWFDNGEAAKAHHAALNCVPCEYYAVVASPLVSNRIEEPDVVCFYVNASQAFLMFSALQYHEYKKFDFTFCGESTCSDSWTRTFLTGKPSLALPCYADKKFAGVGENDIRLTFTADDVVTMVEGLKFLSSKGLRYPIASYSLTSDILDGLPKSYLEF